MVRYRRGSFLPDQHFSSLFFFVKWGKVGFVNTTSLSLEKSWKGWEENRHKQLLRNLKRTLKQLFQCLTLDFQTLRRKVEAAFKLTVFLRVVAQQRRMVMVMVVVMKQTIWRHKRMMEAKAKVMYSHANQLEQLLSFYSILMIVVVIRVILVIRIMVIVLVVVIILIVLVMVIMVMYSHASQR